MLRSRLGPAVKYLCVKQRSWVQERSLVQNLIPGLYLTGLCLLSCSRVLENNWSFIVKIANFRFVLAWIFRLQWSPCRWYSALHGSSEPANYSLWWQFERGKKSDSRHSLSNIWGCAMFAGTRRNMPLLNILAVLLGWSGRSYLSRNRILMAEGGCT